MEPLVEFDEESVAAACGPVVYELWENEKLLYVSSTVRGVFGLVAPVKAIERCNRVVINSCQDVQEARSIIRTITKKEIPEFKTMAYRRMRNEDNQVINRPPRIEKSARPPISVQTSVKGAKPKKEKEIDLEPHEKILIQNWKERGFSDEELMRRAVLEMRKLSSDQKRTALEGERI